MSEFHANETHDPLTARDGDPHLTVHALSEFVFCPRAGLCIHEQDGEYEERERRADTSYLPIYFRDSLERELKRLLTRIWNVLLWSVIGPPFVGCSRGAAGSGCSAWGVPDVCCWVWRG